MKENKSSSYVNQYLTIRIPYDNDKVYPELSEYLHDVPGIAFSLSSSGNYGKVYYSTDDGETWKRLYFGNDEKTEFIHQGDSIMFKGNIHPYSNGRGYMLYQRFEDSENPAYYVVEGNVMSLYWGDNFSDKTAFPEGYTSCHLEAFFRNDTGLLSAKHLVMPATITSCCCREMFNGCTSLLYPPELPATTLAYECYGTMFNNCTSLIVAPELPATTLAKYCYSHMFSYCTSLTKAPVLPATKLVDNCYNSMFNRCSKLNYIKAMFTTKPSTSYTPSWVSGVASSGTFVKNSAATWNVTGSSGVPSGWTVQTASA